MAVAGFGALVARKPAVCGGVAVVVSTLGCCGCHLRWLASTTYVASLEVPLALVGVDDLSGLAAAAAAAAP